MGLKCRIVNSYNRKVYSIIFPLIEWDIYDIVADMRKLIINEDVLKIIALVSMTVDHIVQISFHDSKAIWLSNTIGRLAFPILGFLIMKHFANAKQHIFQKYCSREMLFGLL